MRRFVPEVDQLVACSPATYEGRVPPEYIDSNGHMNVSRYLDVASLGLEALIDGVLGMGPDYRAENRTSVFTAEHHLTYLSELLVGDPFSVHPVVIGRSSRALHLMSYLVDPVRGRVANTVELVTVHVSLDSRKALPFPAGIAEVIDGMVEARQSWGWEPVGCGAMGVRDGAAVSAR